MSNMGGVIENIEPNPIVYFDITINNEKVGRIVIELFKNVCPKTAENFRVLCTGENGKKLHYKDSIFHKAVPECLVQGGDITNFDGTGGDSIYGPSFEDENFTITHEFGGELSTANRGVRDTNNSQFCITTVPCPHLDGAHVVFGRVRKGLDVVKEISYVPVGPKEKPLSTCRVADCGEIKSGDDWGIIENDDFVPPFPSDWDKSLEELKEDSVIQVTTVVKNSGNQFYKDGKLTDAIRKYKKALRYITWFKAHLKAKGLVARSVLFKDIELHCNLNCALVNVKKGDYKNALDYCSIALSIDSQNVKAICRRAQANFAMNNYDLALDDYTSALKLVPNDKTIKNEIKRVKKAMADYSIREKQICARMIQSL